MLATLLATSAALAAPIPVQGDHLQSVGLSTPRIIQDGHGERLGLPQGWLERAGATLSRTGYRVVPATDADLVLRPLVEASGCTRSRGGWVCSVFISWQVAGTGGALRWITQVDGAGDTLELAFADTWEAALLDLLEDPAFVEVVHYGPIGRYNCVFAEEHEVPAARIPEDRYPRDDHWDGATWAFLVGTQEGWFLSGLVLTGGGAVVAGLGTLGMEATDSPTLDVAFQGVALFGAAHFVVGASMLGLQFTQAAERPRVYLTGNGVGLTGRF